jgi:hypothetical protein
MLPMLGVVNIASTGKGVDAARLTEATAEGSVGLRSAGPSAYAAQETQAREHKTIAVIRKRCHLRENRAYPLQQPAST